MLTVIVLSFIIFSCALLSLSLSLILKGKPLEGSCKTSDALLKKYDESCSVCPNSAENGDLITLSTLGTNYKEQKKHT